MTAYAATPIRHTAIAALALAALVSATAIVVHATAVDGARDWLSFSFAGIPNRLDEVGSILLNNLRILAGLLAASFVARLSFAGVDDRDPYLALASGFVRALTWVCDLFVAASAIGHALLVGASIGAYGDRLLGFLFPHGPFELGAYSIALALYVDARRNRVTVRRVAYSALVAAALLVVGAPLEVFLTPN